MLGIFGLLLIVGQASAQLLAPCQNGGTPLNSTNCQCPGFVSGPVCETVSCQRFGIPDKNRCACPPGWYSKYCQLRGCRPTNEDNMSNTKRSVVVVFNTKSSMTSHLQQLIQQFEGMIKDLTVDRKTGNLDNWIENFIVYGFVKSNNNLTTTSLISENMDTTLDFLKSLQNQLKDGDDEQPVLEALKNANTLTPKFKGNSMILVFTDSPTSGSTAWSHRFTDQNLEQTCLQHSLLWKSKISFFLASPLDPSSPSDAVDVYRRLSLSTHGDTYYLRNSNDTQQILKNVISVQRYPEVLAIGYGVTSSFLNLKITRDQKDDTVFILLTINPSLAKLEDLSVSNADPSSQGYSYKLLTLKSGIQEVDIKTLGSQFNYKIFIQSKSGLIYNLNDDFYIDVGNMEILMGVGMYLSFNVINFPTFTNSSYYVVSSNNSLIRDKFYYYVRSLDQCTFPYEFPPWQNTLDSPPGPIIQVISFMNGENVVRQRALPAYSILANLNHVESTKLEKIGEQDLSNLSCPSKNLDVISDPRLDEPKQFIFILELHSNNKPIFDYLAANIAQILNFVTSLDVKTYLYEFTLIVHNDKESHVLLSTYNPADFVNKFQNYIKSLEYTDNLDNTIGLLSIDQAMKMNIQPFSQVYYFTNQAVKNVQNRTRWDIVDRMIEVNFFTISDGVTTEIFALPWQLELIQKSTNGRLIPITTGDQIANIFGDLMKVTALTTDHEKYNCFAEPYVIDGFVEDDATATVIQFVGTGLQNLMIRDSRGTQLTLSDYKTFENANFLSLKIDRSTASQNLTAGPWTISTQTSRGGCQITIRHITPIGMILGFASSVSDDMAATQIPSQRIDADYAPAISVPIRIHGSDVKPYDLEIQLINRSRYDRPTSYAHVSILSRNDGSCSYGFVSQPVVIPKVDLTLWILTSRGSDDQIQSRRLFYYYQHIPADPSICNGGKTDTYGFCSCSDGYKGDYCWDRICVNSGVLSQGVCQCTAGHYGDFCDIPLIFPDPTTPSTASTSNIQTTQLATTTTTSSSHRIFSFSIIYFIILFYLF